jgi:hypothetical protein
VLVGLNKKTAQAVGYYLLKKEKGKEKTTQAVKATPHINLGKRATLVLSTVKLLYRECINEGKGTT